MNYLLWIEDLVNANAPFGSDSAEITGLDVGVGASCVYPLLAAKKFGWKMHGTDIDPENLSAARQEMLRTYHSNFPTRILISNRQNVARNSDVSSKIELHEVAGGNTGPLLAPVLHNGDIRCRFTMCNPPFHQVHLIYRII